MGKPTGFLEYTRELPSKRPVQEKNDYREICEHLVRPRNSITRQPAA
ncbi:hypothetical protein ACQ86N_07160 [Puia sp. P3]